MRPANMGFFKRVLARTQPGICLPLRQARFGPRHFAPRHSLSKLFTLSLVENAFDPWRVIGQVSRDYISPRDLDPDRMFAKNLPKDR